MDRTQEIEQIHRMAQDAYDNDRMGSAGYTSPEAYATALMSAIEHDLDAHDTALLQRFILEIAERNDMLPLPDAATYAGVAYATMAEAVREGRVSARRVGGGKRGTYLTTRAAVDQAIAERKLRPRK